MSKYKAGGVPDKVIAVDPGLKTGIAVWDSEDDDVVAHVLSPENTINFFLPWLHERSPLKVWLVVEKFTITAQTGKMSTLGIGWPLELTGVVRAVAQRQGWEFDNSQGPAAAKKFAPDARLDAAGWLRPLRAAETGSEDHARDAGRHLLLACCESGFKRVPRIGG